MPGSPGFGFTGSYGQSNSTSTQSIDSKLRGLQEANYGYAQGLPQTYAPTSAAQIQSYLNPYTQDVVDQTLADQNRMRQMAVNGVADAATAAGAFGGSRHGVAEALTNTGAIQQAGLLAAQLRDQGYGQALQTAQQENQYGYSYPLLRQGLLNSTLSGITPTVTTTGKQSGWNLGAAFGYGGQ